MIDRNRVMEEIIDNFYSMRQMFASGNMVFSKKLNLTFPQWLMVRAIEAKPGLGMTELSRTLGITCSASTQQIDALVQKGWVLREGNPLDRRSLNLRLTEEMKNHLETMRAGFRESLSLFFSVLNDEELSEYLRLNQKVVANLLRKQENNEN